MLKFIHTYTEDTFEGLFKQGLWREGDGLKLMHKNYLPAEYSFNEIAKKDGLLWNRLKALDCPFYIDRYQGGIPMPYKYDYDRSLLDAYKELLGDKFLGFQMHEWASNYTSENQRILKAAETWLAAHGTLDGMWEHYIEAVKTDTMALFVEAWSVDEWSNMAHPENVETCLSELYRLWRVRREETGCSFIPADSYGCAPRIAIENGAGLLLPEIGWQISGTRLQIAYNRGMAKAAGIPFGVYYECWCMLADGVEALTIPYAADTADNEWIETELREEILARTNGNPEIGGSSRSLQERSWVYSYFSGAEYMGEEYGICNTFRNYRDYELSEYGQVKKKFLDFAAEHPDLGKTYTPVAIVLPAEMKIYTIGEPADIYLGYPLAGAESKPGFAPVDAAFSEKIRHARAVIQTLLYGNPEWQLGGDSTIMQNGKYPDVFDILHADMTDAIATYDYIIDLTGDADFAAAHDNIVTPEALTALLPSLLPCTFSEEVHAVYNKTEDGWLVLVINNNGIVRSAQNGEYARADKDITAEIICADGVASVEKMAGSASLTNADGKYQAALGAGQWMILTVR